MYKVKVLGAGSIGNHLSNASRFLGWEVHLCDVDAAALERTRESIYPARYGKWDEAIQLHRCDQAPRGGFDFIFIGTPPDSHMKLALAALEEKPRALLIEKPLCTPGLEHAQELVDRAKAQGTLVMVGYDHVVGMASVGVEDELKQGGLGPIETIDVEFREHWGGIFGAHPWLAGPHDSYLGYWQRGGAASGEHSHAANLWQHFAHLVGAGRVTEVSAAMSFVRDGTVDYDKICALHLTTESGLMGRVVQDVVTQPPRKWGRIQGRDGHVEWHCGYKPGVDAVLSKRGPAETGERLFQKTRPQDFIQELRHFQHHVEANRADSPLALERGLDTMMVVAAAHKSAAEKRTVRIDLAAGYSPEALQ
ncbi:MAG: Gfo/Idh/MocA family oxidoreductase [Magnetococcales bacterium]|nr:Gfo/Idh/MocA family oxidoreductase [Magnetococcales bacterium]